MTARASGRLAALLAAVALAMTAGAAFLIVANAAAAGLRDLGLNGVGNLLLGVIYPILGWLIASRRRDNPIGWMFLVIAVSQAGTALAGAYAIFGLITRPGALPFAEIASWLGVWMWVPGFVLLFVTILLFPDGRLPSPRWRPVLWLAGTGGALSLVPIAIASWSYRGVPLLSEEPGNVGNDPLLAIAVVCSTIGSVLMVPLALAAVAAVIVRFRHAGAVERQQIKWLAVAAAIELAALVLTSFVTIPFPLDVLSPIVIVPLVPIAIGIAILRYRLFEIDRLVSRTISWAVVTAVLVAVFAALVVTLQTLLAPLTRESTLAVAGSTLVAFALFQPVRTRVQQAVDRRFHRARYDGQRMADTFAERLRSEMDLGTIRGSLATTANEAVRPAATAVWLRGGAPRR